MPDDDDVRGDEYNPLLHAFEIGDGPVSFDDDRLDPDSGLRVPVWPWETQRAFGLAESAGRKVFAEGLEAKVVGPRAAAARGTAAFAVTRQIVLKKYVLLGEAIDDYLAARRVPDAVLTAKRRRLSLLSKVFFFTGDVSLQSILWHRADAVWPVAVLAGVSVAGTMVAAGTIYGHRRALEDQRVGRGPVPENCRNFLRGLYAREPSAGNDPGHVASHEPWLIAAAMVVIAMVTGLTMMGSADSPRFALGTAIMTVVTVLGSAAAEALGTNEAADLIHDLGDEIAGHEEQIDGYSEAAGEIASNIEKADIMYGKVTEEAMSAMRGIRWVAGREADNPRIFDYDVPETLRDQAPPAIFEGSLSDIGDYGIDQIWTITDIDIDTDIDDNTDEDIDDNTEVGDTGDSQDEDDQDDEPRAA